MSHITRVSLAACAALQLGSLNDLFAQTVSTPRAGQPSLENDVAFAYTAASPISHGSRPLGEIETLYAGVTTMHSTPTAPHARLLYGVSGHLFHFDAPNASPLPDQLGAFALKFGVNYRFDSPWSLRAEMSPGIYSDYDAKNIDGFGVPLSVRVVYSASRDLQWLLGLSIDYRSGHPVVGGVGVRWKPSEKWTVLVVLPAPRVEYFITERFSVFGGASLRGGTYRVADDFGRQRSMPELDRQIVDYREIAVEGGVRFRLGSGAAYLGVGRMLDRRFAFRERDILFNGDPAPTFKIGLHTGF